MIFIIDLLFAVYILRETLFWVSLWQLKEYRLDRMWVHLRDTRQGKRAILSLETFLLTIILFLYGTILIWEQFSVFYSYLVAAFLVYEAVITAKKALQHAI